MLNFSARKASNSRSSRPGDPSGAGPNGATSYYDLGAMLRERREAMGATLAEVESATRIRQKYLAALESDEWHLLPGEVVGRGFLRNYSDYLGLDAAEAIDRRRAVADVSLATSLVNTSAGTAMPPMRQVDYRPKEVDLKDDPVGIQHEEVRAAPFLLVGALVLLLLLGWWGISAINGAERGFVANIGTRVAALFSSGDDATPSPPAVALVNAQNLTPVALTPSADASQGGGQAGEPEAVVAVTQPPEVAVVLPQPTATTAEPTLAPTTTPEPPTATPEPPTPTFTPEVIEAPTDTPTPEPIATPEPPPVIPPACADLRSVLSSPGANQVLSGVVGIVGTASHESLQYYKLEYAPGADAGDGFVYFDGRNGPVSGGLLGSFNTGELPNGVYTLRLTVVDQSGNFPPPCQVTVTVQN